MSKTNVRIVKSVGSGNKKQELPFLRSVAGNQTEKPLKRHLKTNKGGSND
jgi:hypothetical protein